MHELPAWWDQAACLGAETDLFFPVTESRATAEQVQAAKAVCGCCAVRVDCLDWALASAEQHGVWGGTTEAERVALLRHRGLQPVLR